MAGTAAIFWLNDADLLNSSIYTQSGQHAGLPANNAEDNIPDSQKVELGEGALVPDGRAGLVTIQPKLSRRKTDNPAPFEDEPRRPDTGFAGTRYTLSLVFNETSGISTAIRRLLQWSSQENTTPEFRRGRVGLRVDTRAEPEISFLPTKNKGYKIVDFDLFQDLAHPKVTTAVLTLEQQGVLS